MSNTLQINKDGYTFTRSEDFFAANPTGILGVVDLIGKRLVDLNKEIEELVKGHENYKYYDDIFVEEVVVYLSGEPMGVVTYLDDIPQYIPFKQERILVPQEGKA